MLEADYRNVTITGGFFCEKQKLVDSGILHTQKYLEWYNNDEEKANK